MRTYSKLKAQQVSSVHHGAGKLIILPSLTGKDMYQVLIADSLANEGVKASVFTQLTSRANNLETGTHIITDRRNKSEKME